MGAQGFNDWRLVSLSPLPPWALALLILAALAGLVLAHRGLRKERHRGRRAALLALRAVSMLAAIFLLLEPGVRLLQTSTVKNRVAILVDRSGSMAFPASPGGPSRAEVVSRFFASTLDGWKKLGERFTLEPAAFDREASPVELARLTTPLAGAGPLGGTGTRTDLLAALRAAAEGQSGSSGKKLSGIVLVSDGADNAGLGQGLSAQVKSELQALKVPIDVLAVGQGGLMDLAVENVKVDDFAFVRNPVTVEATIESHGVEPRELSVVLKREGRVVATQSVHLDPSKTSYEVTFPFAPDETGQFVYTVSVPVLPGEAVTSNNSRSFVLKVIRDRMRVLYVVGRPSWDERFLRGLLKQDPNVDLISFFILRTGLDNPHTHGDDELSLIPFPVKEIFDEQLHTFDVVIFQNFAHRDRSYAMDMYLPGIRDYIEGGGAFAMVGGENSFGDGKYNDTALADALPVEMDAATPARTDAIGVRLTEEGKRHPVTQVLSDVEQNAALFAGLPPLLGLNVVRAKPGAQVLLETAEAAGAQGMPVLTLGEFGRGRVMALATDGLWQWTLPAAAKGTPSRAYDRVWTQALRWLVKDPDLTTLRIQADHPMVEPGAPVGATITVRKPDYSPAAGASVAVTLLQIDEGKTVQSHTVTALADGTAHLDLGALPPGAYKLVARVQRGEAGVSEASDAVAVRAAGPELSDAAARPELLKQLAELTGGSFTQLPRARMPELPLQPPEVVEVGARKDQPVWDTGWPLLVLVLALGAEWALRRRWGHL